MSQNQELKELVNAIHELEKQYIKLNNCIDRMDDRIKKLEKDKESLWFFIILGKTFRLKYSILILSFTIGLYYMIEHWKAQEPSKDKPAFISIIEKFRK